MKGSPAKFKPPKPWFFAHRHREPWKGTEERLLRFRTLSDLELARRLGRPTT